MSFEHDFTYLVSASAINQWEECERKWGFRYLEGDRPPQKPSAALGQEVEEQQLQPWLLEARALDYSKPTKSGYIAEKMLPLLPPPKTPGITLQRKVLMPSARPNATHGYIGYIDLFATDSSVFPGLRGGVLGIGDFKTTKHFRWAKNEEALLTDPQAMIYAMYVMFADNVDVVDLAWTYGKTVPAYRAQRTHLRVLAPHVAAQFERLDEIGERLAGIKQANPPVRELKPNALMCDAYGGCPYRHKCNLSPTVVASQMNQASTGFLARQKALAAGTPAPVASPPTPPAPATAVVKAGDVVYTPMGKGVMTAEESAKQPLPAFLTAPVDPLHAKSAINPPESALPPAPAVAPAAVEEKPKRGRKPKAETVTIEQAVAAAAAPIEISISVPSFEQAFKELIKTAVREVLAEQTIATQGVVR